MCDEKKIESLGMQISCLSPMIVSLEKTLIVTNKEIENLYKTTNLAAEERKKIREVLYGNGNPSGGLSGRVNQIETWMGNQVWFQRLIIALLVAEAVGVIWLGINHVIGS
jgi:hypothetical protein